MNYYIFLLNYQLYITVEKKQKVSISHLSSIFTLSSDQFHLDNMQWFPFLFDIKFPMPHGMSFFYDSPFWIILTMIIQQRSLFLLLFGFCPQKGIEMKRDPRTIILPWNSKFAVHSFFFFFFINLPLFHSFIVFPSFFQQIFILYLLYVKYYSDNRIVSKRVTNSL